MVKNPPANAGDVGDVGSILGLGRSPGAENGKPLHCSCLKISWREPCELQSMGSQRAGRDLATKQHRCFIFWQFN